AKNPVVGSGRRTCSSPRLYMTNRIVRISFVCDFWLSFRRELGREAILSARESARELVGEFLRLEDLTDLDLGSVLEGTALGPFDRLIERLHLPQPQADDELIFGAERTVGDGPPSAREYDPGAFRAGP